MNLTQYAEEVARRLPEEFYVRLTIENGWAGVTLCTAWGLRLDLDDGELTLEEQVLKAVEKARELDSSQDE